MIIAPTKGPEARRRRARGLRASTTMAAVVLSLAAAVGLGRPAVVRATNVNDFTVTPATGGAPIDPESAGRAWTTLTGPTIDVAVYSNPDAFPPGLSFTLTLPPGFEWNRSVTASPTVTIASGMPAGFCTLTASKLQYATATSGPSQASFTLAGTHDVGCTLTLSGLQVRPATGVRGDAGGYLAVGWTVPGVGVGQASAGRIALGGAVSREPAGGSSLPPTDTSPTVEDAGGESLPGTLGDAAPFAALLGLLITVAAALDLAFARRRSVGHLERP